jgi:hypothetical protein
MRIHSPKGQPLFSPLPTTTGSNLFLLVIFYAQKEQTKKPSLYSCRCWRPADNKRRSSMPGEKHGAFA